MKASFRIALLSLIVAASLASYAFLHHRSVQVRGTDGVRHELEQVEEATVEGTDLNAPDLMFLQKVYETARRLVPMVAGL